MATGRNYIVELIDKYSAPLRRISETTRKFNANILTAYSRVGKLSKNLKKVGNDIGGVSTYLSALGAGIAARGIGRPLYEFELAMNKVAAVTFASSTEMREMRKVARELGRTTEFTAVQSAEAMKFLGMAGLRTNEILAVMPDTLNLAAAGSLDLGRAADLATNIHKAFRLELNEFSRVVDVLAYGAATANSSVEQFAGGMKNVAGMAYSAGISIEETTALMMGLANAGTQGEMAGTQLMNAIRLLVKPTKQSRRAFRKYRIDIKKFVEDGKLKDFIGLIKEVGEANVTTGDLFRMFDIRGGKAIALLKNMGVELSLFVEALRGSQGAAEKMAEVMMTGFPGAVARFRSAWESVRITIGQKVLPEISTLLEKSTAMFNHLEKTNPELLRMAGIFTMIAVAITAVLVPLGLLVMLVGSLMSPVTLVLLGLMAIIAAITYIVVKWESIKGFFKGLWEWEGLAGSRKADTSGAAADTLTRTSARAAAQTTEVAGNIKVAPERGAKVTSANINIGDLGNNLAEITP